jgi:hypothetical protein
MAQEYFAHRQAVEQIRALCCLQATAAESFRDLAAVLIGIAIEIGKPVGNVPYSVRAVIGKLTMKVAPLPIWL